MKFKMAVPKDILTGHQIDLIEQVLADGLLGVVARNFPNWQQRSDAGTISGGEIILQETDFTRPIKGLKRGIHLTISLISYMPGRNFDGLAEDTILLIKRTQDGRGTPFMDGVDIFVQMTLDRPVVKAGAEVMLKEIRTIHEDNKYFRANISALYTDGVSYDRKINNLTVRVEKLELKSK